VVQSYTADKFIVAAGLGAAESKLLSFTVSGLTVSHVTTLSNVALRNTTRRNGQFFKISEGRVALAYSMGEGTGAGFNISHILDIKINTTTGAFEELLGRQVYDIKDGTSGIRAGLLPDGEMYYTYLTYSGPGAKLFFLTDDPVDGLSFYAPKVKLANLLNAAGAIGISTNPSFTTGTFAFITSIAVDNENILIVFGRADVGHQLYATIATVSDGVVTSYSALVAVDTLGACDDPKLIALKGLDFGVAYTRSANTRLARIKIDFSGGLKTISVPSLDLIIAAASNYQEGACQLNENISIISTAGSATINLNAHNAYSGVGGGLAYSSPVVARYPVRLAKINSRRALVMFSHVGVDLYAGIAQTDSLLGVTLSYVTTPFKILTISAVARATLTRLSSTRFVMTYSETGAGVKAVLIRVSGDTITADAPILIDSRTNLSSQAIAIDASTVALVWRDTTNNLLYINTVGLENDVLVNISGTITAATVPNSGWPITISKVDRDVAYVFSTNSTVAIYNMPIRLKPFSVGVAKSAAAGGRVKVTANTGGI
jgi:hypothetical protein